ncbi:MAG: hypothetical protein F2819_00915 [Actinobacteria bacterium]|nr:hypothetical protein [Actinomycetota bacterium]
MPTNHKGRDIAELITLYVEETFGSKSKIPKPTFIATPRIAPRVKSANKSDFQLLIFDVKKSAIKVNGAIDVCAKSERIAQLRKSLDWVLA